MEGLLEFFNNIQPIVIGVLFIVGLKQQSTIKRLKANAPVEEVKENEQNG